MAKPCLASLAVAGALLGGCHAAALPEATGSRGELRARRGDLEIVLALTGELEAARAESLSVPTTPSGQAQIRWLARDGADVRAGEKVAEFDDSELLSGLEDLRAALEQAGDEASRQAAEGKSAVAERELAQAKARGDLEKAQLDAAVPAELLSQREHGDRQLRLERARVESRKASAELGAAQAAARSDGGVAALALDKARREVTLAESNLGGLMVRAPRDGVLLVGELPWEGRKLQVGDQVWPGFPIATLPDLTSLRVSATLFDVDDGRVAPGMAARLVLDAYPAEALPGTVTEIGPVAREPERQSLRRGFKVVIRVDDLPAGRYLPGMSVRAEIVTARLADQILVPRQAIDFATTPPRVHPRAGEARAVTVAGCNAHDCAVSAGVREGDALTAGGEPAS